MISKKYKNIIKAAVAGGKITKKYFGKVLELEGKTRPSDFRTKADLESEKAIIKILEKSFPTYNIISEEAGEINKNSEYTFEIDPLDGTNNFVLGIPYFSIGIGLNSIYLLINFYYLNKINNKNLIFENKIKLLLDESNNLVNNNVIIYENITNINKTLISFIETVKNKNSL